MSTNNINRSLVLVVRSLRALTLLLLFAGIIILATGTGDLQLPIERARINFANFKSLRYVMAAQVIAFVYVLVQLVFLFMGSHQSYSSYTLTFFGDLTVSYMLMSAGSAGVAVIMQAKEGIATAGNSSIAVGVYKVFRHSSASISMMFIAFLLVLLCVIIYANNAFGYYSTMYTAQKHPPSYTEESSSSA